MVGIDFDFKVTDWETFYKVVKAYFELQYLCGKVTIKETYKGYHLYADCDTDPEKAIPLRIYLGDDEHRIMYDIERLKQSKELVDVLYKTKLVLSLYYPEPRTIEKYVEREMDIDEILGGW